MKKEYASPFEMFLRMLCIVALSLTWINCDAQKYVTDGLLRDSVAVFPVITEQTDTVLNRDDRHMMASGVTMDYTGSMIVSNGKDYAVMRTDKGEIVAVQPQNLSFSTGNPPDMANTLQDPLEALRHTPTGHFFYTLKPYLIIFALLAFAVFMTWLVSMPWIKSGMLTFALVAVSASAVLGATALEVSSFIYTGMDPIWWVDAQNVGFLSSLLRLLPLWLAVGMQLIATLGLYSTMDKFGLQASFSWTTLFACLVLALVADVVIIIVMSIAGAEHSSTVNVLTIVSAVILGIGIICSLYFTISKFKFWAAIILTVIDLILVTGVVTIGCIFLLALIRMFLRSLIYLVLGGLIASFAVGRSESSEKQRQTPEKKFDYKNWLEQRKKAADQEARRWQVQRMYWRQSGILKL